MIKKIFRYVYTVVAIMSLIVLGIVMAVLYGYFQKMEYSQLAEQTELAAAGVSHEGMDYFTDLDSRGFRITWVGADGEVLYDNQADVATLENHADRPEIVAAREHGYGQSSRYSSSMSETTIYGARLLPDQSVIRVSTTRNSLLTLLWGMLWPIALVLFIGLIISYVISDRLTKYITRPLEDLDLDHPLDNDTYEEFAPFLEKMERQRRQIADREKELVRRTDEFLSVTSNMSEALVLLSKTCRVLALNTSAKQLWKTDDSIMGESFLTVDHSYMMQELIDVAQAGGHLEKEYETAGKTYTISSSPVKDGGIVLLAWDISDKAEAERMRREFTANVSHELKTPVQTIMGSSELIKEGMVYGDEVKTWAGKIYTESERLVTLIDDIIRLSQLDESEGMQITKEHVDIAKVGKEVMEALSSKAENSQITMTEELGSSETIGERRLVYEIIFNLVDNAIKYNHEGGYVTLSTTRIADHNYIKVVDDGIGIPATDVDRIWERFYRVDKSRSKSSGGTGLGLSIVKHAVMQLGGSIDVDSIEGSGTTILVKLPVS